MSYRAIDPKIQGYLFYLVEIYILICNSLMSGWELESK